MSKSFLVRVLFFCCSLCFALSPARSNALPQKSGDVRFEPDSVETGRGQKIDVELGWLSVPENRTNPSSRLIELAFVRLRSTVPNPGPPTIYLAGGPGTSGIDAIKGPALPLLMALQQSGDVILLDQRGTGISKPSLVCNRTWDFPLDQPGRPKEMLRLSRIRMNECLQDLRNKGIDLKGYNTNENADDVAALAKAIGAAKVNLWGLSYGTHLALTIIRRHEAIVNRAILNGVQGPDESMLKLPSTIQRQLTKFNNLSQTDARLSTVQPDILLLTGKLLSQLAKQPVTSEATDPRTKQKSKVTVGKWDFQFFTASPITQTWGLKAMPSFYSSLAKGDFTPLAQAAYGFRRGQVGSMMPWMTICASGASAERQRRVKREAKESLLGDAINFPFPEICSFLGKPQLPQEFRAPVRSDVPVLFVSGTLDGRTPVEQAEEAQKGFSHGEHLVVAGASHGFDLFYFFPQQKEIMLDFLQGKSLSTTRISILPFQFNPQ